MAKIAKPRSSKGFATFCARIAQDRQAENIVVLNLSKIDGAPSDYFVICSCNSQIQVRAVADAIETATDQLHMQSPRKEGLDTLQWAILDYFDVVVHIFHKEARDFYKLEKFWADAQFFSLDEDGSLKTVKVKKEKTITLGEDDPRLNKKGTKAKDEKHDGDEDTDNEDGDDDDNDEDNGHFLRGRNISSN